MSKLTVYKFNTNNQAEMAYNIVNSYLNSRGFYYDNELNASITGKPNKDEAKKNAFISFIISIFTVLLAGRAVYTVNNNEYWGTQYFIDNDGILTMKLFMITFFGKKKIGGRFKSDINKTLFNEFKNRGIVEISKETEKIDDGSGMKAFLFYLLLFFGIIAVSVIIFFILIALL